MKKLLIAALLVASACKDPNAPVEAKNLADAAAYAEALDKCYTAAVATYQTTHDADAAAKQYETCADAADKVFGVQATQDAGADGGSSS